MIITEDDKKRVIAIAQYLRNSEESTRGAPVLEKYWYYKSSIIYYISNGLSLETSKEMTKTMVKELNENLIV